MQRLFREYVGVSPKWVLQRYRLHEAAARLAEGTPGTWAAVAADLGYSDQSHFIRDFTRAVGLTPGAYAAECLQNRGPLAV
jgi:AraC-like DNA-binding protein